MTLGSSDSSVQDTNDDAQVSKLSCARQGYFRDDFIHCFVRKKNPRRSPLINRGYYSRHAALKMLHQRFLELVRSADAPGQVLVLGAGFDTSWFQLAAEGQAPHKYLELDFAEVTKRKASVIATQPQLMDLLEQHAGRSTAGNAQGGSPAGGYGVPVPLLAPPSSHAPIQQAPPASTTQLGHSMQGCGTSSAQGGLGEGAAGSSSSSSNSSSNGVTSSAAGTQAGQVAGSHGQHTAQQQAGGGSPQLVGGQQQCQRQQQQQQQCQRQQQQKQCQQHPSNGVHVCAAAGEVECGGAYSILPADLRDLQGVRAAISRAGLDTSAPTYILAECVLVYMDPVHSAALVRMLGQTFTNAAIVVYEQVRPYDAFGRQMRANLEDRGCPLLGLTSTPTLEAHCLRLTKNGWQAAASWDMDTLYRAHLDAADRARIERLEIFDEFEEWHMIQEHYCITVGVNCRGQGSGGQPHQGLLAGFGFGRPQWGGTEV